MCEADDGSVVHERAAFEIEGLESGAVREYVTEDYNGERGGDYHRMAQRDLELMEGEKTL